MTEKKIALNRRLDGEAIRVLEQTIAKKERAIKTIAKKLESVILEKDSLKKLLKEKRGE